MLATRCKDFSNHRFEFHKRRQLFIRTHNEALSDARLAIQIIQPSRSSAEM